MSRENVERIGAALAAFNESGEIVANLAPDFEMHQASSIVDTAGVFHGRGALGDSLRELQEDGVWKLVHRHADPITDFQPAESVIQVRSDAR